LFNKKIQMTLLNENKINEIRNKKKKKKKKFKKEFKKKKKKKKKTIYIYI